MPFAHAQKDPVIARSIPAELRTQLISDLESLRTIESPYASLLHRHMFGELSGIRYLQFFKSRIRVINFEDTRFTDRSKVAVAFYDLFSDQMYLTQNYVHFKHPQIARVMTLFHEARHAEKEYGTYIPYPGHVARTATMKYKHVDCPKDFKGQDGQPIKSIWTGIPLAGEQGACDNSELGAYSTSAVMLKNISKYCANCSTKMKLDAEIYADDQMLRVINPAAQIRMHGDFSALINR